MFLDVISFFFVAICASAELSVTGVAPANIDANNVIYFAGAEGSSAVPDSLAIYQDPSFGQFPFVNFGLSSLDSDPSGGVVFINIAHGMTDASSLVTLSFEKSGSYVRLPIYSVNAISRTEALSSPTSCSATNCALQYENKFFAARTSIGSDLRVGFLLKDFCSVSLSRYGATPAGCDTGGNLTFSSGVVRLSIRVAAYPTNFVPLDDDDTAGLDPKSLKTGSTAITKDISLHGQINASPWTCPTGSEGFIQTRNQSLAVQVKSLSATNSQGSSAPLLGFLVAGSSGDTLNLSTDGLYTNGIYKLAEASSETVESRVLSGFENTSSERSVAYKLSIHSVAANGIITLGNGPCSYEGVWFSSQSGILNESQCFIATAAFHSLDVWPVWILRKFRDHFLNKFSFGKALVQVYERESPSWARALIEAGEGARAFARFIIILSLVIFVVGAFLVFKNFFRSLYLIWKKWAVFIFLLWFGACSTQSTNGYEGYTESERVRLLQKTPAHDEVGIIEKIQSTPPEPDTSSEGYSAKLQKALDQNTPLVPQESAESYSEIEKNKLLVSGPNEELSAIDNFNKGEDELHVKRPRDVSGVFGFGLSLVRTDDFKVSGSTSSLNDLYGNVFRPEMRFSYELLFLRAIEGTYFGLGVDLGFRAASASVGGSGSHPVSGSISLLLIPLGAHAYLRFNQLSLIKPYGKIGILALGAFEFGGGLFEDKSNVFPVLSVESGIDISLDWLSARSAGAYQESIGARRYHLNLGFQWGQSVSSQLAMSGLSLLLGMSFDI